MTSPHSEERPVLHCLSLRNNGEHQGLMAQIITDDNAAVAPLLSNSKERLESKWTDRASANHDFWTLLQLVTNF